MTFNVIATGSDGNATIINESIVVDIGVPYKAIKHHVKRFQLVLLTHIHGDHFNPATVKRLAMERPTIRWGCCEWMVKPLLDAGVYKRQIDVYLPDHFARYSRQGISIKPVRTPHNVPNCAYQIKTPDGSAFYATDCGSLDGIENSLVGNSIFRNRLHGSSSTGLTHSFAGTEYSDALIRY